MNHGLLPSLAATASLAIQVPIPDRQQMNSNRVEQMKDKELLAEAREQTSVWAVRWRGSQVVRHGSAKAAFVGSIPTLASTQFYWETGGKTVEFQWKFQ